MLRHLGGFEFLLVGRVDGRGLLADELGFLDGEFFIGFDLDFASFFVGFLFDEGRHLLELLSDLWTAWLAGLWGAPLGGRLAWSSDRAWDCDMVGECLVFWGKWENWELVRVSLVVLICLELDLGQLQ